MNEEVRKKTTEVVQKLLDNVETNLNTGTVKATLSEYLRLVQLRKELDEDEPKNIEVKWVESEKSDGQVGK